MIYYITNINDIANIPANATVIHIRMFEIITLMSQLSLLSVRLSRLQLLQELYCNYNRLDILPSLPNSLRVLKCTDGQLTMISSPLQSPSSQLPQSLQLLDCSFNRLLTLPILPPQLRDLYISNNYLTTLPPLPHSLQILHCSFNRLKTLPCIPPLLRELWEDDGYQLKQYTHMNLQEVKLYQARVIKEHTIKICVFVLSATSSQCYRLCADMIKEIGKEMRLTQI